MNRKANEKDRPFVLHVPVFGEFGKELAVFSRTETPMLLQVYDTKAASDFANASWRDCRFFRRCGGRSFFRPQLLLERTLGLLDERLFFGEKLR